MQVWRIEHDDGSGVYRGRGAGEVIYKCVGDDADHPSPIEDGMPYLSAGPHLAYSFGFKDLAQLKRWFSEDECECMGSVSDDLRVVLYDVPRSDILIGGHQIAFRKDLATRIRSYPLTQIRQAA